MRIQCALSGDHDHSTTGLFVGAWGNGDAKSPQGLRQTLPVERQTFVPRLSGACQALVRRFCLPFLFPFGECFLRVFMGFSRHGVCAFWAFLSPYVSRTV